MENATGMLTTWAKAKSCSRTAPTTATPCARTCRTRSLGQRQAYARRVNIPAFSPFLYRYRNLVERFFNKLKHFRAIATRFEKHDANYLALIKFAAARIWMRFYELVT